MKLTRFLVVLSVCLYLNGVQSKRGPLGVKKSVTLEIHDAISFPQVLESVTLRWKKQSILNYLIRAAEDNAKFEFNAIYRKADGLQLTAINSLGNDEDSLWKVVLSSGKGKDEDPINLDLTFVPKKGDTIIVDRVSGTTQPTGTTPAVINAFRPIFVQPMYHQDVPDGSPPGISILTVEAMDSDLNSQITYSISGEESTDFSIDPASGEVTVAKTLDSNVKNDYILTVKATDGGSPPLFDKAKMSVRVIPSQ